MATVSDAYTRHRVKAAKEVLFPGNSWWAVTLYHDSEPMLSNSWSPNQLLIMTEAFQRT
jgi:hypothetical protein